MAVFLEAWNFLGSVSRWNGCKLWPFDAPPTYEPDTNKGEKCELWCALTFKVETCEHFNLSSRPSTIPRTPPARVPCFSFLCGGCKLWPFDAPPYGVKSVSCGAPWLANHKRGYNLVANGITHVADLLTGVLSQSGRKRLLKSIFLVMGHPEKSIFLKFFMGGQIPFQMNQWNTRVMWCQLLRLTTFVMPNGINHPVATLSLGHFWNYPHISCGVEGVNPLNSGSFR